METQDRCDPYQVLEIAVRSGRSLNLLDRLRLTLAIRQIRTTRRWQFLETYPNLHVIGSGVSIEHIKLIIISH